MTRSGRSSGTPAILASAAVLLGASVTHAQQGQGRPIGKVTTQGDIIVLELDEGVLTPENLFDLEGRTLRFTPDGRGYRVANLPLAWDAEFGAELTGTRVDLRSFEFPFSGRRWNGFTVGRLGTISFDPPAVVAAGGRAGGPSVGGGRGGRGGSGGPSIGRFEELQVAGTRLVGTTPFISVFQKPRMSGERYVKELRDRVVVTWSLTEPSAGIQDFTWVPTVNRFQAVLRRNGSIDLSYQQLSARDAIVGVYPVPGRGARRELAAIADAPDTLAPAHLDLRGVRLTAIDDVSLEVALETRGPVPPEGDPRVEGVSYRVYFDVDRPLASSVDTVDADVVWTIEGRGPSGRGGGDGTTRWTASGPGMSEDVTVQGSRIAVRGTLPPEFRGVAQVGVAADAITEPIPPDRPPGTPPPPPVPGTIVDQATPRTVALGRLRTPAVDFSNVERGDGAFPVVFEAFHYAGRPRTVDMACSVITALGDRFDFFVWYSDFRIDNQEAGTPSTGPRGGNVTGIGRDPGNLRNYCSDERLQWMYVQPVYVHANQAMERSPDGTMNRYWYAMSQVGHELGHRWSAFVTARVDGETIELGPTHWDRGLHAPAAFPYRRPVEASLMGGGVWQDNYDGTFTQLDDNFYVPATGWSHLELYLMGLASKEEVPDFFMLRNLERAGEDALERAIFRADRVRITVDDVIASEGPRRPESGSAQTEFNTGIVAVVMPGKQPSPELIERTNAIRERWIDFWSRTTGGRSTMTVSPNAPVGLPGTVTVDGAVLRYVVEGVGEPCIVIGSLTYYRRLFSDEFKRHFRCAYADTRMFTRDAQPPPDGVYDLAAVLRDVDAVRRALGWDRVVTVGHSLHAHLALEYARAYPEHTTRVVMIGMSPGWPTAEAGTALWDSLASGERKTLHEGKRAARAAVQADSTLTASERFIRTYVLNAALYWYDAGFDASALWQDVEVNVPLFDGYVERSGATYDLADLPPVDLPVFVGIGRHDYVVPFGLWDERSRAAIPDLTFRVFENSGHTPQYEEASRFDAEVVQWLERTR